MQRAIVAALDPLVAIAHCSSSAVPDCALIASLHTFVARHERASTLEPLLERACALDFSRLAAGLVHGDYWLNNLLFDHGRVTGIIDWDMARAGGCVALDALHLGLMTYSMWANRPVSETLACIWTGQWRFPWLGVYLDIVAERFGLRYSDIEGLAALLWLWYLYQKENPSAEWQRQIFDPLIGISQTWKSHHEAGHF
jgi:hypothetical protein